MRSSAASDVYKRQILVVHFLFASVVYFTIARDKK
jgi:hypothetical protein